MAETETNCENKPFMGVVIFSDWKFPVNHGLHQNESSGPYSYDILEEFEYFNFKEPIKRCKTLILPLS